ncbi:12884_t:CDS:1, partial [Funneliformis geosporum]
KRIIPQKFSEKQVAKFRKEYIKQVKSTKIEYLEIRVQKLINMIQKQRKKIITALSPLLPEGELLQELIKVYLEFIEFKNLEADSADYNKRCNNYEDRYWKYIINCKKN